MERLSKSAIPEFVQRRRFAVVHIDAGWDAYQKIVADKIRKVQPLFAERVSFGYVDSDAEEEFATELGIRNVPAIAYYRDARLFGVVIGIQQDLAGNIERLMREEPLNQTNVLSSG